MDLSSLEELLADATEIPSVTFIDDELVAVIVDGIDVTPDPPS